jgi:hypothetical protein
VRNDKIHEELLGKFRSSKELDRLKLNSIDRILAVLDRSNKMSIDRNFPERTFAEARHNTQSGAFP